MNVQSAGDRSASDLQALSGRCYPYRPEPDLAASTDRLTHRDVNRSGLRDGQSYLTRIVIAAAAIEDSPFMAVSRALAIAWASCGRASDQAPSAQML